MNPPGKASPRVLALFETLLVTILQLVGKVVLIVGVVLVQQRTRRLAINTE